MGNQSRLRLFIGYFSYLQNIKIRKRHLVETKLRAGNQVLIMMKLVLAFVGLITSTNGLRLTNGKMQWDAYLYCPNGDRVKAPYHHEDIVEGNYHPSIGVLPSVFIPNRSVAEGIFIVTEAIWVFGKTNTNLAVSYMTCVTKPTEVKKIVIMNSSKT